MVLYLKGGGARPTHNYAETCEDINKLSRMVVLIYSFMGDTLLSPLTVSISGASAAPDSPSFLYLHQENLVTSLDAHCPKPIESRMSVQPGLSVLTVSNRLVEMFRHLERHLTSLCKAVDGVFKETRKRKKHAETEKSSLESGIPASERPRA